MGDRNIYGNKDKMRKVKNEGVASFVVDNTFNDSTYGTYADSDGYFFIVDDRAISIFDNQQNLLHIFITDDLNYFAR